MPETEGNLLDLEVSTRPSSAQPLSLAPRKDVLSFRAPQAALSGRVLGVDASVSETPIISLAVVAIVLTLMTGVTASFLSASTRGQTEKLTAEVGSLQKQLRTGPVADQLKRQQTVSKQLATLNGFLADAIPWPVALDSLSALVPASTKLSSINIDAQQSVRLEGETGSQDEVATFLAALDASSEFATPRLDSLSLNESVDGSMVTFSIATRYAPEQPAARSDERLSTSPQTILEGPDAGSSQSATEAAGPDATPVSTP